MSRHSSFTSLHRLLIVALVLLHFHAQIASTIDVKIGALFDNDIANSEQMLRYAVQALSDPEPPDDPDDDADTADDNRRRHRRWTRNPDAADDDEADDDEADDVEAEALLDGNDERRIRLRAVVDRVDHGNEYQASRRLCKMLRGGIAALFGPSAAGSTAMHCTNICDAKELPYIDVRWDAETRPPVINVMPHPDTMGRLLVELVRQWNWKSFTVLYESAEWLPRAARLLQLYANKEHTVTVRRIHSGLSDRNYRAVLRRVRLSADRHVVLACSVETLPDVLQQALQVGLLSDRHQIIVTTPDLHTIDLEPYQYSGANITGIRFVRPDAELVRRVAEGLLTFSDRQTNAEDDEADDEDDERDDGDKGRSSAEKPTGANDSEELQTAITVRASQIRLQTALIYDAALLLMEALRQLSDDRIRTKRMFCNTTESWENGNSITNFMRNTVVQGLTGEVKFDNEGLRTQFNVEIVEMSSSGLIGVGEWNSTSGLNMSRIDQPKIVKFDDNSMQNKTFIVLISLTHPYGMLKDTAQTLNGNDRFEGFGIDLIQELSRMHGFNYTFRIQEDGKYGSYNNATGEWDGMIRELRDDKADLAITDLTITSEREIGADFTMPFMNLGISILYRKPTKQPPSTFSFMSPFSTEVWIYLGCAYLGVSLCLFILGRISPSEWDNPYPCIEEPTMLENQFSLSNSMWFAIGALLQQGSEIAPKAPSTRVVASIWWFFTLIMVSSYTANLAAFLTVESLKPVLSSAEELKDCHLYPDDRERCPVTFGAKKGGSTLNFFKDSKHQTYKNMHAYMEAHPELQPKDNDEGIAWAKNASLNYAYLMESTTIQYYIERICEITQVGGLLDEKGYGIAMKKNSEYRGALSEGVLRLQETGKLTALKTRWWKEKKGGGACESSGDNDQAAELDMYNMYGVFIVLLFGSVLATIFGLIDCLLVIYRKSKMYKVPFKEEFMNELKFIALCKGDTKTVRHRKSASLDSQARRSQSNDSSRQRSMARNSHDSKA